MFWVDLNIDLFDGLKLSSILGLLVDNYWWSNGHLKSLSSHLFDQDTEVQVTSSLNIDSSALGGGFVQVSSLDLQGDIILGLFNEPREELVLGEFGALLPR